MKLLIVVCVHSRINNIKRWIELWKTCNKHGGKLCVVHCYDGGGPEQKWLDLCQDNPGLDLYVPVKNRLHSEQILHDLLERRFDVPFEWDTLLFATDDTLPMRVDFIDQMLLEFNDDVGSLGTETSPAVRYHLRTNFYMTKKEVLDRLTFFKDPLVDKMDAYGFEHWHDDSFTNQILKMGLSVKQVNSDVNFLAWDTDHHRGSNLWESFWSVFPGCREMGTESTIEISQQSKCISLL